MLAPDRPNRLNDRYPYGINPNNPPIKRFNKIYNQHFIPLFVSFIIFTISTDSWVDYDCLTFSQVVTELFQTITFCCPEVEIILWVILTNLLRLPPPSRDSAHPHIL